MSTGLAPGPGPAPVGAAKADSVGPQTLREKLAAQGGAQDGGGFIRGGAVSGAKRVEKINW